MSEPTIYKPSIYKGTGIYKTGAGGGGGGGVNTDNLGVYLSSTENDITLDIGGFNTGTANVNIGFRFIQNSETSKGVFEIKNNGVGGIGFLSIRNGTSSITIDGRWGSGDIYNTNRPAGNAYNSIWSTAFYHKNYPDTCGAYNQYAGLVNGIYTFNDGNKDFNQITLYIAGIEIYFVRIKDNSKDLFFYPYKNEGVTNGLVDINTGNFIEVLNSFVMPYSY